MFGVLPTVPSPTRMAQNVSPFEETTEAVSAASVIRRLDALSELMDAW